jgi:hypothetical protein
MASCGMFERFEVAVLSSHAAQTLRAILEMAKTILQADKDTIVGIASCAPSQALDHCSLYAPTLPFIQYFYLCYAPNYGTLPHGYL